MKNKTVSLVFVFFLSLLVLGSAFCTQGGIIAAETSKQYTLEELFEMDDDRFLELYIERDGKTVGSAMSLYADIKKDIDSSDKSGFYDLYGLSGVLSTSCVFENGTTDSGYIPNETENKLKRLIGKTAEYTIKSPITRNVNELLEESLYYSWTMNMVFPEYYIPVRRSELHTISHKSIINLAKCCFCVNQVIDMHYQHFNDSLSFMGSDEKVIKGDVNFDGMINSEDVLWLAKSQCHVFELSPAQKIIGDLNGDGIMNALDNSYLIESIIKRTA